MAALEGVSVTVPGFFSASTFGFFSAAFLVVLLYASVVDIRERIIPNRVVVIGVALWCGSFLVQVICAIQEPCFVPNPPCAIGLVFNGMTSSFALDVSPGSTFVSTDVTSSNLADSILSVAASSIIGAFGVSALALACAFPVSLIQGGEPLGAGDVKLLFPIGLFVGFEGGIAVLGVACVASLLYCLARFVVGRPARDFPFAPFLAIGFLVVNCIVPVFLGKVSP